MVVQDEKHRRGTTEGQYVGSPTNKGNGSRNGSDWSFRVVDFGAVIHVGGSSLKTPSSRASNIFILTGCWVLSPSPITVERNQAFTTEYTCFY